MRIAGALISGLVTLSAAGQIVTTMTVEPARVLRGIPVSLSVSLTNAGTTPVAVPRYFAVEVTLPDGSVYVPGYEDKRSVRAVADEYAAEQPMQPGETRMVYLPLGHSLAQPGMFTDLHLSAAGSYVIRAILDDRFVHERYQRLKEEMQAPAIMTADATFEVIVGTAADASVWDEFLRMTNNRAASALTMPEKRKLGAALLPKARDSAYRGQLVIMDGPSEMEPWLPIITEALPLIADHPYLYDELSLSLIRIHETLALTAAAQRNHRLAHQRYEAARALLNVFKPKTDLGTKRAVRTREEINTLPEQFLALQD
jgi:hypothetical protein